MVMNTNNGKTYRKYAVTAGVLYIIGTVSGIGSAVLASPLMTGPDFLVRMAANAGQMNMSAFLQFLMAISCAGICVALYPVMKRFSEALAIGAVGFRFAENILQIFKAASMIALLVIGQEFVRAGAPEGSFFQSIASILSTSSDWMTHGATLITWSIGAILSYIVFYQHRLVPRWITLWGLVSFPLTITTSLLVIFGILPGFGTIQIFANLSIALQEMAFAVWLIVKGVQMPQTGTVDTGNNTLTGGLK